MKKHPFYLFFPTLLLIFLFILPPPLLARKKEKKDKTEEGKPVGVLGVGPPIFELECKPGEKKTLSLKLDNPNPVSTGVSIYPHGLVAAGYTEVVSKPIGALPPNALGRHITIESPNLLVPARSYKNISITLDVPEGLTGTQYVGLTAASSSYNPEPGITRPSEYEMGIELGMQPAVGVTIKCHMVGTMNYSYSLDKLETKPASGNEPTTLLGTLKNTGNGEIIMAPTLILLDSSHQVVSRLKPEARITMVPGGTYKVTFKSVFSQIPSGSYEAVLSATDPKYNLPPISRNIVIR